MDAEQEPQHLTAYRNAVIAAGGDVGSATQSRTLAEQRKARLLADADAQRLYNRIRCETWRLANMKPSLRNQRIHASMQQLHAHTCTHADTLQSGQVSQVTLEGICTRTPPCTCTMHMRRQLQLEEGKAEKLIQATRKRTEEAEQHRRQKAEEEAAKQQRAAQQAEELERQRRRNLEMKRQRLQSRCGLRGWWWCRWLLRMACSSQRRVWGYDAGQSMGQ